jgi:tetratricopeptide (TPR) repeat protein
MRDGGAAATLRGFSISAIILALATSSAVAEPKLEPKLEPPPPPRVREIAHRLFEEAVAATAEGKLDVAIARYHELDRLAPHPNIAFNLALSYERRGELVDAIKHYDNYLAIETADTKVARHVAGLRATPGQVALEAASKFGVKAVWYFDGDLVAHGTKTLGLRPGRHKLDMISELGYQGFQEVIEPGHSRGRGNRISADADARKDGNLVISNTAADRWGWFYSIDGSDRDDKLGKGVHHNGRYSIAVGKHTITVRDQICEYDTTVVVGRDELVYVYFDRQGFDHRALLDDMKKTNPACGKLIVKRSVVKFDAKAGSGRK